MPWNLDEVIVVGSSQNTRFNNLHSENRFLIEAVKPNPTYPDERRVGWIFQKIQTSVGEANGVIRRVWYGLRLVEFPVSSEQWILEFKPYYWTDPFELRFYRRDDSAGSADTIKDRLERIETKLNQAL